MEPGIGLGVTVQDVLNGSIQASRACTSASSSFSSSSIPGGMLGTIRGYVGGLLSERFPARVGNRVRSLSGFLDRER